MALSDASSSIIKPTWLDIPTVSSLLTLRRLLWLWLPGWTPSSVNFCLYVIQHISQRVLYNSTPAHVAHLQGEGQALSSSPAGQAQAKEGLALVYSSVPGLFPS